MPATEIQTECSLGEQINSFLANRLDVTSRKAFVSHLAVCEPCAALLRDLREDARLARMPLTSEERTQIRAIVSEVREEVAARLDGDRNEREASARAARAQQFEPPGMGLLAPSLGRVLWFSLLAAGLIVAAVWLLWK